MPVDKHNKNNSKCNLLIIGNGFDIHCGLNSRFTDFFNRYDDECDRTNVSDASNELDKIYSNFFNNQFKHQILPKTSIAHTIIYKEKLFKCCKELLESISLKPTFKINKGMNFFFLYFGLLDNHNFNINRELAYNWCDIENQLYVLLYKYSPLIVDTIKDINKLEFYIPGVMDDLKDAIKRHERYQNNLKNNDFDINKTLLLVTLSVVFLYLMNFNKKCNFYKFLFHQLNIFEKDFGYYINYEETSIQKYIPNAKSILQYIKENNGNKQKILSFNYTDLTKTVGYKNIRNVHSMFNNPIIGIDSSQNNSYKQPYYMFTKTYRTLRLINEKSDNSCKVEYTTNILPSRNNIKRIIFYGHSLGIEDYSYFMAIFDYYHIYNSNVQLIFYYNDHNGNDESRNQYVSIFKLINHYGASIHHGENLLHKLILENRIHIKYLHAQIE